jgi:peptidoglycan/LPS O-acetylase OafA/YrhL
VEAVTKLAAVADEPPGARVPVLDGIRGIAILLVLWFHFMPDIAIPLRALEWLRKSATGGWIGVELFFVLSGFLITGILLDTKTSPNFLKNFYGRRVLRIFPLYYASLLITLLLFPKLGIVSSYDVASLDRAGPWLWSYCANIGWFLQAAPRISWPAPFPDLRHFWSLAIEEHFYLAWPLIVVVTNLRQLKRLCCLLFGLSLFARVVWIVFVSSDSIMILQTPFLLDPLAAGAFVAVTARDGSWRRTLAFAKWTILASSTPLMIFFFMMKGLWASHWLMASFGISAASVAFAASIMLTVSAGRTGIAGRAIGSPILRFFGKYSYGLYVVHPIVVGGLGYWISDQIVLAAVSSETLAVVYIVGVKLVASIVVAMVSWHVLEKNCLRMKSRFSAQTEPSRQLVETLSTSKLTVSNG